MVTGRSTRARVYRLLQTACEQRSSRPAAPPDPVPSGDDAVSAPAAARRNRRASPPNAATAPACLAASRKTPTIAAIGSLQRERPAAAPRRPTGPCHAPSYALHAVEGARRLATAPRPWQGRLHARALQSRRRCVRRSLPIPTACTLRTRPQGLKRPVRVARTVDEVHFLLHPISAM